MRVLTIFIDMIRANRLATFDERVLKDTPLDEAFRTLGGTVYTNCFTPGPDTPRGMASYYTGLPPYKNGCSTRLKWPKYFLNMEYETVFHLFLKNDFALNIFTAPNERINGLLPNDIVEMDVHNDDYDLDSYLSKLSLRENHFVFISLPDFHWAFDDNGYSKDGESKAYRETKQSYDMIFKHFDKDDFDHIFIFSDHGFKFLADYKLDDSIYMLDEDRTHSIMLHRAKGESSLKKNDKLCSLADLYPTYQELLHMMITQGVSLFDKQEHEFIVVEDHISFAPQVNQNIELWSVVEKESIYIRKLERAVTIDRYSGNITEGSIEKYDTILKENSCFGQYIDEYEKTILYRQNIVIDKEQYMSGRKRVERNIFITYGYIVFDIIKKVLANKKQ